MHTGPPSAPGLWRPLAKKSTANQRLRLPVLIMATVAILLATCKILLHIEVENRHFAHCILIVDPSRQTPSNIIVIYTLLKSIFSGLQ